MQNKNKSIKASFSKILLATTVISLFTAPYLRADVTVPAGEEWDIPSPDHPGPYDFLTVLGTANILNGAVINYDLQANAGSQVNIKGGSIGDGAWFGVTVSTDSPSATVTVYGTEFEGSKTGPINDSSWTPNPDGEVLSGKYEGGVTFSILFRSDVPILLAPPGTTNLPPVAIAGQEGVIGPGGKIHPIYSSEQDTTTVLGQASDPEGQPIEYRWLEGATVLLDWTLVETPPEAYLDLSTLPLFSVGDHTLVLEVREVGGEMLQSSDDMVLRILPDLQVSIDIKPGSYPNSLNINGHGVIPVAILGSADFDVNQIDVSTLSFAGLALRVKGNGLPQCSIEDVSGDFTNPEGAQDGWPDLVCQFVDDTENWLPGDGTAKLEGKLLDGTPIEGTDTIRVVQE